MSNDSQTGRQPSEPRSSRRNIPGMILLWLGLNVLMLGTITVGGPSAGSYIFTSVSALPVDERLLELTLLAAPAAVCIASVALLLVLVHPNDTLSPQMRMFLVLLLVLTMILGPLYFLGGLAQFYQSGGLLRPM